MKIRITYILILFLAMAVSSCEKIDMDEYLKPDLDKILEEINNTGQNIKEDGEVQTEGAVDLGLSVKWAACNLDKDGFAKKCTDIGSEFDWASREINTHNLPEEIGGTSLDPATVILGGKWQTPSTEQWEELNKLCRIHYTIYEGVFGYIITGPSKKAIFIPEYIPDNTDESSSEEWALWSCSSSWYSSEWYVYAFKFYRDSISFVDINYYYGSEYAFFNRPVERK